MTSVAAKRRPAAIAALNSAFEAAVPDTYVRFVPKAQYGSGGMVDMLLATQAVVPERLPALAVVDVCQLPQLLDSDVLLPVDDLATSAAVALPASLRDAVSREGRTFWRACSKPTCSSWPTTQAG
jgi:hypothetical protein